MTRTLTYDPVNGRPLAEVSADPRLPSLVQVGPVLAPRAPSTLEETGVDVAVLLDLALKAASTVPSFTTEWVAQQLRLPRTLVHELLDQLRGDRLLEVLGAAGPFGYRYGISQRGRERADWLLQVSGYIGPAPVTLEAYTALLEWQLAHSPPVSPERVAQAVSELVLTEEAEHLGGLAVSSGRSLFLFGPAGNGKTTLGRLLHRAREGDFWVPSCIGIEHSIIRIFDDQVHEPVHLKIDQPWLIDQRWVRIRRPFVVVGGEATIESFELSYSPALRFYEAPLHLKANGGTFLIDDFGRQRVDPFALLNRWIVPLENRVDYLTLRTGQKIQVPFLQMLVVATNLTVEEVTDPAFLRRMGYRVHLDRPSAEHYAAIFARYAAQCGVSVEPGVLAGLLERYRTEGRDLRACEPRDLIERVRDICQFHNRPLELSEANLSLAWMGYFGVGQGPGRSPEQA